MTNMKKIYNKPTMQVIGLSQQPLLLGGSQNPKYVPVYDYEGATITKEKDVW